MRYIRYTFLALIAICLLLVALANRQVVTLRLLPADLAELLNMPFTVSMPLFLVVLAGVAVGLLVGFVWEWAREHRYRAEMQRQTREKQKLQREIGRLRTEQEDGDEVLALLESAEPSRRAG